jgi:hypothetical protein
MPAAKYHGQNGPLYIDKIKSRGLLPDYFVNAAKELGYKETDPNSGISQSIKDVRIK